MSGGIRPLGDISRLVPQGERIFERIRTRVTRMQDNQPANQGVVVYYDTPGGERLHITHLAYHDEAQLVEMQGSDAEGNRTVALVPATELQITVRYVSMQQHDRRPISFEREGEQG